MTAIDVAESSHERLVLDVTCSASDSAHAEQRGDRRPTRSGRRGRTRSATGPSCSTSAARSRSTRRSRSATATTSRWPTPLASAGSAWRWPTTPTTSQADDQGRTPSRWSPDGSAVLGLRQHRPGAALPVMEGKAALFKRFADIDAWPICLASQDADEIVRRGRDDRARLRWHQPRGHRRPAVLRDRAPAPGEPRHPGLPRRPARYGDRRHRRAHQRAARGEEAAARHAGRGGRGRGGRLRDRDLLLAGGGDRRRGVGPRGLPVLRRRLTAAGQGESWPRAPTRAKVRGDLRDAVDRRRRVHRGQRSRSARPGVDHRHGRRAGACSPSPTRTRRSTRPRRRSTPRWWPAAGPTTPTRSTTCSRSPGSSAACSTPAASGDHRGDAAARGRGDRARREGRRANPNFIIPTRLQPRRAQGRRRPPSAARPVE